MVCPPTLETRSEMPPAQMDNCRPQEETMAIPREGGENDFQSNHIIVFKMSNL